MVYAITINESTFTPAKFSSFSTILNVILPIVTAGASLTCLAIMLLGAFKIITNGENPEVIKKSITTILYAGFGLGVVIASFVIVKLVGKILGVENFLTP